MLINEEMDITKLTTEELEEIREDCAQSLWEGDEISSLDLTDKLECEANIKIIDYELAKREKKAELES